MRTRRYEDIMRTRHYEDQTLWGHYENQTLWGHYEDQTLWGHYENQTLWGHYEDQTLWGHYGDQTFQRQNIVRTKCEQNVDKPMETWWSVDIPTWWRSLGWAVPCPPVHTSSSLWTGGTGRACRGRRARSRGWRWPRAGSGGLLLGRSVSPGHKREPSLKPWETHSIRRHAWGGSISHTQKGARNTEDWFRGAPSSQWDADQGGGMRFSKVSGSQPMCTLCTRLMQKNAATYNLTTLRRFRAKGVDRSMR